MIAGFCTSRSATPRCQSVRYQVSRSLIAQPRVIRSQYRRKCCQDSAPSPFQGADRVKIRPRSSGRRPARRRWQVHEKKYEQHFETLCKAEKVLLTSNGTLALHVAALALQLKTGDEIIISTYTYVSTVNAFTMRGDVSVFVDIDESSLNIALVLLERATTARI